ncbi:MAG: metallophosphoesterase [Planctomycetota bacterium]
MSPGASDHEPDLRDPEAVAGLFHAAAEALLASPWRRGSHERLPARGRLLATGDLHDNPLHLQRVVAAARLEASPEHHLTLHELIHGDRLINGMDFSHRILARVASLVLRHPGQVHPLLANHELSQLTGAGVSKGAGNSVELFRDALGFAFGDAADDVERAIEAFIAAMPLALIAGEGGPRPLLCAHSLPSASAMDRFDPAILERPLEAADRVRPDGGAYLMTWGRGYDAASATRLAEAWGVAWFVLGHQHVDSGIECVHGRCVVINSDHEAGRVLPIDLADPPPPSEAVLHAMPLASMG